MSTAAAVKDEETAHRFAKDHLKAFVERIERLEEEKTALADDIRDVFAEAKGNGFDVKALRQVVRLRKQDKDERAEQEAILETYLHAMGMLNYEPERERPAPIKPTPTPAPTPARASAALAQAMADDGLISQEAADEAARSASMVDKIADSAIGRLAANPKIRAAIKNLGAPVELTEEERANGYSAAFVGKDGTRMTIGDGRAKACDAARDETIPEPAKGDDPSESAAGGVLIPTKAAQQIGEPEAGAIENTSAGAPRSPYLPAPADLDAVEGDRGDDREPCPALHSTSEGSSPLGVDGDERPRPANPRSRFTDTPGGAADPDLDIPPDFRVGDPANAWLRPGDAVQRAPP